MSHTLRTLTNYWKSLRLPWRKRYLIGTDLQGNTFWEFRDRIHASRPRRIVEWNTKVRGFEDVKVSPMWHQWLRNTRTEPPSLEEQVEDVRRLEELKVRAELADRRWEAKGRVTGGQGEGGGTRIPIAEGKLRRNERVGEEAREVEGAIGIGKR